jgi:hypothetical protein
MHRGGADPLLKTMVQYKNIDSVDSAAAIQLIRIRTGFFLGPAEDRYARKFMKSTQVNLNISARIIIYSRSTRNVIIFSIYIVLEYTRPY